MSIEKLTIVNVVGPIEEIDTFAKNIYLFDNIQIIDALEEVNSGRFTLPMTQENINEILGLKDLATNKSKESIRQYEEMLNELNHYYGDSLKIDNDLIRNGEIHSEKILEQADIFLYTLKEKTNQLNFNKEKLKETKNSINYYSYLKDINIPMRELIELKNFSFSLGTITNDNAIRLKLIYPSIPSVLFHLGETDNSEQVYFVVSENNFSVETDRVLKALDFKELKGFDSSFQSTPKQIVQLLEEKKNSLEKEVEILQEVHNKYLEETRNEAELLYNQLSIVITINTIKNYVAFSEDNFYFSGWLPKRLKKEFEDAVKAPGIRILYQDPDENNPHIPTKLRNNWLFKPFEKLIKMYGIPNYLELDPTPFFSLTYILCFGYMFGDVGQGLILFLVGWYIEKKGSWLGGIASRVAIASIVFGFLYGSVFGLEDIIPALWLRPMENTTTLLLSAVVLGVFMILIAYIYSLINKKRQHEEEEEYFGKNGISGFLIYILILAIVLMIYNYLPANSIVEDIIIGIIVVLTIAIFLAMPLMNLLKHRRFMYDINGEYYIASFFEVFEMYLSMLSNTLSFIRVGAFALTHVGMFMAFQTIANMAGGGVAGVIILIIGNIFILGLEGLIDFIQCLRLEFYELFGKYFNGDGIEFVTVSQEIDKVLQR